MSRISRRAAVAAALITLGTSGVVAGTATAASATPNFCRIPSSTIDWVNGSAWTQCTGGTGWYRVRISCRTVPNSNWTYFFWGDWVTINGISIKACPADKHYIVGASMETAA